jgi:hypothetical protein
MRETQASSRSVTAAVRLGAWLCLALAIPLGAGSSHAQEGMDARAISIFEIPRIEDGERSVAALIKIGDLARAETQLGALIKRYPSLTKFHFEMALLLLRQDRKDAAIQNLKKAVATGLPRVVLERTPALDDLRPDPAFKKLVETAKTVKSSQLRQASTPIQPSLAQNGVALVSVANTGWDPHLKMLRSFFRFGEGNQQAGPATGDIPGGDQLNTWFLEGTAAGNYGDLYDNRDGGHSALPAADFPQLTRIKYGKAAQQAGIDRGPNRFLLYNAVAIGNASLAITSGPMWRSLPRAALTDPLQVACLFHQYSANQIYVYPAHNDYGSPRGDLFPANTPYMLISRGSSGSDQPLLKDVASILAAFRPEVKAFLQEKGLISPTVQWIFRRSQFDIESDDDYLSGRAHPSAFSGRRLNVLDMIQRAHSLDADNVPPMVRLRVKGENHGEPGVDIMLPDGNETLFDTPSAIARVVRSTAYEKRLVLDASETADPNGRPLTFRWSVLRGDKTRTTIRLLNKQGNLAEIIIPWDAGAQPADKPNITDNRVDIGVFANNGKHWSAPAFISVLFPGDEKRRYRSDKKIAEIDYHDPRYQTRYVDPVLFPVREWRDSYIYDSSGHLLGWTRFRGETTSRFTRDGSQVVTSDQLGRPLRTEEVRYAFGLRPDGRFEVLEVPTRRFVTYSYKDDSDYLGAAVQTDGG